MTAESTKAATGAHGVPLARERQLGVIAKRPIANAVWRTGSKPADSYHHAYWDRIQELDYPFLKEDLARSIEIAYELCDLFTKYDVDMEVHADINTNPGFKSNEALREAMGYILGMGFAFKAKPDAFASSCCADKMVN